MPTLSWIGKDKVENHHLSVPYRLLNRSYTFGDKESENKIIHGDNLLALKSLLPEYEGRVKCIYIDPPYNTGNENWVYNDNVNDPQIKKWLGEVVGKEGEDLSRHDKWLCMMYPRLRLLKKLLSDDGAIFISIDDNELYNLKFICDEIFGVQNFFATLTRRCMHTVRNSSKDFNKNSDFILVYARNKQQLTEDKKYRIREKVDKADSYKLNDNDGRGFYKLDPIYARNYAKPYTFTFQNGIVWTAPEGSYPRYSQETLAQMELDNKLDFNGKSPRAKRYLNEVQEGQPPDTVLKEEKVGFNSDGTKILAQILGIDKAFSQPKPVQLIEYLIGIMPYDKDSIILDSFAGSGTTAHAVLNLNKQDGGNRKFILIEMMDYAETITAERVKRVIKGYGEGKKKVEGAGGGFSYYELGDPLMNGEFLNEDVGADAIRRYVYFTETKQTLPADNVEEPYYLGTHLGVAYYFYYEREKITALSWEFLSSVRVKAESYVIYADICALSVEELIAERITFKKIPRDIKRI